MRLRVPIAALFMVLCTTALATAARPSAPAAATVHAVAARTSGSSAASPSAGAQPPRSSGVSRDVIGGRPAEAAVWPYLAVVINPAGLCTGELVAAQWLLTARHCIQTDAGALYPAGIMHISLGDGPVFSRRDWQTARRIVPFPSYNPSTASGDLALVELSSPTTRQAVDLALVNANPSRDLTVSIAGWGLTTDGGSIPDFAQQAQTVLWTQSYCSSVEPYVYDPATELCAGGPDGLGNQYPSVCNGDSGGPLVAVGVGTAWTDKLLGITDYGSTTGCAAFPNVFQDVPAHAAWIIKTTGLSAVGVLRTKQTHATHTSATVTVWLRKAEDHTTTALISPRGTVVATRRVQSWHTAPVTLTVAGLAPGVRYPGYRVITSDAYGSTGGARVTLATPAIPCRLGPHGVCHGRNIRGDNLSGRNLAGIDLRGANATRTRFQHANLSGANLSGANLTGANLASANLTDANLTNANLTGAILPGANLTRADLHGAHLGTATLAHAVLSGISSGGIVGVAASLPASWSLVGGYLIGPGADLRGATLRADNLAHTDLSSADLSSADLTNARLGNANLTGANLTNARLTAATLTGATLTGVVWANTTCPDGTNTNTNSSSPASCIGH